MMNPLNPAITIAGRELRQGGRPLLIAEIAQAHDGSLGFAHSFVDVVADAGFDAIKFQTHIAAAEIRLRTNPSAYPSAMKMPHALTIGGAWSSRRHSGKAWKNTRQSATSYS